MVLGRRSRQKTQEDDEDNVEVEFIESRTGKLSKLKIKSVPVFPQEARGEGSKKRKRGDGDLGEDVVESAELISAPPDAWRTPQFIPDDAELAQSTQSNDVCSPDDDNKSPPVFMEGITQSHTGKTSQGRVRECSSRFIFAFDDTELDDPPIHGRLGSGSLRAVFGRNPGERRAMRHILRAVWNRKG